MVGIALEHIGDPHTALKKPLTCCSRTISLLRDGSLAAQGAFVCSPGSVFFQTSSCARETGGKEEMEGERQDYGFKNHGVCEHLYGQVTTEE